MVSREHFGYAPVKTVSVKGFTHCDIQGVETSFDGPFREGHVGEFSVVGLGIIDDVYSPEHDLSLISDRHGRSYELFDGQKIFWQDEFGNLFMTLNTKGNNLEKPSLQYDELTPSNYRVLGMQDGDSLARMLKASRLMRSLGIDTELLIKVIEPAELPYEGELVSTDEFKRRLIQNAWEMAKTSSDRKEIEREDIPSVSDYLDKAILFITVRAAQVNERLADSVSGRVYNKDFAREALKNAFIFVNKDEAIRAVKDAGYEPQHFSMDSPDDVKRYLNDYLPSRLGRNLGRLHRAGLIHEYPHSGNISWTGSFFDLDSVQGEPLGLGDEVIDDIEKISELKYLIVGGDYWPSPIKIVEEFLGEKSDFGRNFLRVYFREVGWTGTSEHLSEIVTVLSTLGLSEQQLMDETLYYFQLTFNDFYEKVSKEEKFDIGEYYDLFMDEVIAWKVEIGHEELVAMFKHFLIKLSWLVDSAGPVNEIISSEDPLYRATAAIRFRLLLFHRENAFGVSGDEALNAYEGDKVHGVATEGLQLRFYQRFVEKMGWEEDIANHAGDIEGMMELGYIDLHILNDRVERQILAHYLELFTEQTGLSFEMDQSAEEMIELFHEYDQEQAEMSIAAALAGVAENASRSERNKVVDSVLVFRDSKDRYIRFVGEYIEQSLALPDGVRLYEMLIERFGEYNQEAVFSWLIRKWEIVYIDNMKRGLANKMIADTGIRLRQLKRSFLNK